MLLTSTFRARRGCRLESSSIAPTEAVHRRLAAVTPLIDNYRAAGMDVTFKVYPGGRHEMLNETNRDEVVADLMGWLEEKAL